MANISNSAESAAIDESELKGKSLLLPFILVCSLFFCGA